ncbi:MAG TPA: SRPBCC family protein [Solirubrobacteraceae bacterium]
MFELPRERARRLADLLGWASIGLGVPQVSTPRSFDRAIGVVPDREARAWTFLVGLRELGAAASILVIEQPHPVRSVWGRVAGDAMDLTLLARSWRSRRESPGRLGAAIGAVVVIGAIDTYTAVQLQRSARGDGEEGGKMKVKAAITVDRPREEVYSYWRQLENLPSFMDHLQSVSALGDRRSRWKVNAPAGRSVEWEAETTEERPGELIAWRSVPGSDVGTRGAVRFQDAPGGRGTEVHVELEYDAPGGSVGAIVAKLFGEEPHQQVRDDLRRFKQVIETGEVVRSEASPEGASARRLLKQRPAEPLRVPVGAGAGHNGNERS